MSVGFPEEKYNQGSEFNTPKSSIMVRWVMKTGLVRDEKQANMVLLGLAVLFFVLTAVVIFDKTDSQNTINTTVPLPPNNLPSIETLRTLTPEMLSEWGTTDEFAEWGIEI